MIFLIVLTVLFFTFFVLSLRLNIKQQEKIEKYAEELEKSLDILDVCYRRIYEKSNLEVFSDEPVVKQLVSDIKVARDAIVLVANILTEED